MWVPPGNCPALCGAGAAGTTGLCALCVIGTQSHAAFFLSSSLLVHFAPIQIKALGCCWLGVSVSSDKYSAFCLVLLVAIESGAVGAFLASAWVRVLINKSEGRICLCCNILPAVG